MILCTGLLWAHEELYGGSSADRSYLALIAALWAALGQLPWQLLCKLLSKWIPRYDVTVTCHTDFRGGTTIVPL